MKPWLRQLLVSATCGAVLLSVLSLYLRPSFLMDLANQIWICF